MLIQRVEVASVDVDAGPRRMQSRQAPPVAINGGLSPATIFMRPGAVERWRVLNGSVDGRGTKSFMVLEGQFVFADRQLWQVKPGLAGAPSVVEAATRGDIERATRPLYQLSFDGITLVTVENGKARHTIRDLSKQNAGSQSPLDRPIASGADANERRTSTCSARASQVRSAGESGCSSPSAERSRASFSRSGMRCGYSSAPSGRPRIKASETRPMPVTSAR